MKIVKGKWNGILYEGGFDTAMKSMAMFLAQLTQHLLIVKK